MKRSTIAVKVPDELAVFYAMPGGVPADKLGIPILEIDVPNMLASERKVLMSTLKLFASRIPGMSGKFPTGSDTDGTSLYLQGSVNGLPDLQRNLRNALSDAGLGAFVAAHPIENASKVRIGESESIPASYSASALGSPMETVFTEIMLITPSATRTFDMSPLPGSGTLVEITTQGTITADASGGGAKFKIPLLVPEGTETGDGRIFKPLALSTRDLPIPLQWQIKSANGHDGSVLVGRIDSVERVPNGLGNAYGVFDTGPYGREAQRLVQNKMLRGISADLDHFETVDGNDSEEAAEAAHKKPGLVTIKKGRVMAATLVTRPAFQECRIEIVDDDGIQEEPMDLQEAKGVDRALAACAVIASSIPLTPPRDWFTDPMLRAPSALTVDDTGRVYGHIALWHVSHVGLPGNTKPPRSSSNYAYFKTGVVRTGEGDDIHVGQLTLSGGHADLSMSAHAAVQHYDETNSAIADVTVGEDAYGIWVAGGLRPGITPEQVRTLRASAPSGDWRPINGRLELVAICQVNVPGFPVARARVASGYVTALVAAGAAAVAQLRGPTVEDRLAALEAKAMSESTRTKAQAVSARFASMAAQTDEAYLFRMYSEEARSDYAKQGIAMEGGQYPIKTVQDLRNAIRAYGRAAPGKKTAVKRHIIKRAKDLDKMDLVPQTWSSDVLEFNAEQQRLRIQSLTASLKFRKKFDENKHLRDTRGRFRQKLAKLHTDIVNTPGAEVAGEKLIEAEKAAADGKLDEAEGHAEDAQKIVDRFEAGALERDSALREGYTAQGGAIAHVMDALGLDPTVDNPDKYRFSDIPEPLKALINGMLTKLVDQIPPDKHASDYVAELLTYMNGSDLATTAEIQKWVSELTAHLLALREKEIFKDSN